MLIQKQDDEPIIGDFQAGIAKDDGISISESEENIID